MLTLTSPSGYQNGIVSPNTVAYNFGANPAVIDGGVFDLNSAYLTGAWSDGLQVEVQGFVGATLTYNNTYTVNTAGPDLVNFDYSGVDKVIFISSGGRLHPGFVGFGWQFVMDNLSVTIVPEPSTLALAWMAMMLAMGSRLKKKDDIGRPSGVRERRCCQVLGDKPDSSC